MGIYKHFILDERFMLDSLLRLDYEQTEKEDRGGFVGIL